MERKQPAAAVAGILAATVLVPALGTSAYAKQVTGIPGSPTATKTTDGKQLLPSRGKFGGVTKHSSELPFRFNGTINKLTFRLGLEQLTAQDKEDAARNLLQTEPNPEGARSV